MLRRSIEQLALWHQSNLKIYITVSIFDATDEELPSIIEGLLKANHMASDFLKIELTEKACLNDQARSLQVLKQLADLGVKLVISDFCSGYSSFIYLTNFPISEIKIDKSFVMSMMSDDKKMTIVRAAIKLADAMNLVVFADGIGDQQILKKLKQLGCLYGQGSYFSKAISSDDLSVLLSNLSCK